MAADPSSFDYYRRGQPLNVEKGRPDESGFDYYRRGQPLIGLVSASTYTLTASTGSFTLSGNAAELTVSRKLTASTAAFVFTGNSVNLIVSRKLSATSGSFSLSGNNASLIVARVLSANSGSFILTGNDANLRLIGSFILIAQSGTFLINGNSVELIITNPIPTNVQTGDGFRRSEAQRTFGKTEQEKQNELLEEEREMVFSMFQMFIISNN